MYAHRYVGMYYIKFSLLQSRIFVELIVLPEVSGDSDYDQLFTILPYTDIWQKSITPSQCIKSIKVIDNQMI